MERKRKQVFALFLAGRSTFPASLLAGAAREVTTAVEQAGYGCLLPPKGLLSGGAVSSRQEGEVYAQWLRSVEGQYDGVLMSLPNFGDENGAAEAMTGVQVPIFIHAYPDEAGKMDIASRRDAYCGKISIMNALRQRGIPFTVFEPHVVRPETVAFAENLREFASVCRMVNGGRRDAPSVQSEQGRPLLKRFAMMRRRWKKLGVTVETYDLLYLYERVATRVRTTRAWRQSGSV